ncbi:NAD(P)H-quinone oxidoreductase subunit 1 [Striga asiatica]|uniref:NAD(P)H-quinone oxidoreductase subunit 1 n=1 Tax=Striga asiatica TaxID=4170 RepID=A0A5A7PSX1_STRAF|nr:NAD(P)H-quinone oxidoreductase subunit 1 [Striga asiatica]
MGVFRVASKHNPLRDELFFNRANLQGWTSDLALATKEDIIGSFYLYKHFPFSFFSLASLASTCRARIDQKIKFEFGSGCSRNAARFHVETKPRLDSTVSEVNAIAPTFAPQQTRRNPQTTLILDKKHRILRQLLHRRLPKQSRFIQPENLNIINYINRTPRHQKNQKDSTFILNQVLPKVFLSFFRNCPVFSQASNLIIPAIIIIIIIFVFDYSKTPLPANGVKFPFEPDCIRELHILIGSRVRLDYSAVLVYPPIFFGVAILYVNRKSWRGYACYHHKAQNTISSTFLLPIIGHR